MATYDFRKKSSISTGQKITPMYSNNNSKHRIEERIENLEIKLDKILNLLEDKKDKNNG